MIKWNNLFKSLMHKYEVGYPLDVSLITDHCSTVQDIQNFRRYQV